MINCTSECRIGRGKDCDIQTGGWRSPKLHALIELREKELWIVDRGSNSGTWINRERVIEHGPLERF